MINTNSIRFRVALIVSLAITVSLGGFALFLDAEIRAVNEREETAKLQNTNQLVLNLIAQTDAILRQQADGWSHTFVTALAGNYTLEPGETPILKLNGVPLNGSTREVDAFTSSSDGNVATLFARQGDDFVRIATSLKKEDGQRAVGTKIGRDHPAYATVNAGKTFTGKATLFGRPYMTQYEPIKDAKGELIGLHFVGINILSSLNFMKETIGKVKLGETGYVYVLDASTSPAAGTLLIHPTSEGKNIGDAKDSNGRPFIREILERRNGSIVYPWLNAGEKKAREKIVVFNEYKNWQWIVASGSYSEEIFSLAAHARNIMIGATFFLTVLLLAILVYYLNRIVLGPLRELVIHSRRIADGDLTVRIDSQRRDEVGKVLNAMQQMVDKLREIIGQVTGAASDISGTAQTLATTTQEISTAAECQSKASASAAASLEEVSASITEVSALARETENSSRQTAGLTGHSVATVRRAVAEIGAMATAVRASANEVGELRSRSEEVGGIAGVIREIAEQTNLLALNAAIEAARAGESGRGFAVVADEVRKLAERTAAATHEIAGVVGQIQQRTQQTVAGMEAVVPQIESGLQQVGEVAALLDGIAGEAERSMSRAVDVAGATREQAAAAADISRNVEQIAHMTEETNANMRGSAEGAQRLEQMAVELRKQVAYFRLG